MPPTTSDTNSPEGDSQTLAESDEKEEEAFNYQAQLRGLPTERDGSSYCQIASSLLLTGKVTNLSLQMSTLRKCVIQPSIQVAIRPDVKQKSKAYCSRIL